MLVILMHSFTLNLPRPSSILILQDFTPSSKVLSSVQKYRVYTAYHRLAGGTYRTGQGPFPQVGRLHMEEAGWGS